MATKEEQAREQGWVPQEEWTESGREADDWVDASEFVFRGELMNRISQQTGQIRTLRTQLDTVKSDNTQLADSLKQLGKHNKKLAEAALDERTDELRRVKAQAQVDGDVNTIAQVEKDIDELREAKRDLDQPEPEIQNGEEVHPFQTPEAQAKFAEWSAKNPWYNVDQERTRYAQFVGNSMDPNTTPVEEFLQTVQKSVEKAYGRSPAPKGGTGNLEPSADGGPTPPGGQKGASGATLVAQMSETELAAARTFVKQGAYESVEDYAKELQVIHQKENR